MQSSSEKRRGSLAGSIKNQNPPKRALVERREGLES
jgi:hypothetical protein